jgi:MFS family permease
LLAGDSLFLNSARKYDFKNSTFSFYNHQYHKSNDMQAVNRNQLFVASCLALLVTSLSFGIRAGILGRLGVEFGLDKAQLGTIAATAFWGFPLAVIIGGMVVDVIGMKRLLVLAFVFHLIGIVLTIFADRFATPFWSLFISTLFIGIANGTVEAACIPLSFTFLIKPVSAGKFKWP